MQRKERIETLTPVGEGPGVRVAAEGDFQVKLGSWDEFGDEARRIRVEVFVTEQGVPLELEIDSMDPVSVHAMRYRLISALMQ